MPRPVVIAVAAALVLSGGACGSNPTPKPSSAAVPDETVATPATFTPTFAAAPCPDDVSGEVVYSISCGYLTVLEDRSRPAGRTVRGFVVRIDPPGGTTTPDPMVMVGDGNFGSRPDYGGLGGRMHRVEYVIDRRGSAHSEPNLDCPEVTTVSPTLAGLRFGDPAHAASLHDAVGACHDRLTSQGIDVAAFDLAAGAADVEDLRVVLGIGRWNAIAYGTSSRQAFEVGLYSRPVSARSSSIRRPCRRPTS